MAEDTTSAKRQPPGAGASSQQYFRRLRARLALGLLGALLGPLALVSAYLHFQFSAAMRQSGRLHVLALAESQRNTVDLFLQERLVNVFGLFRMDGLAPQPSAEQMTQCLKALRQASDAFVDVGVFDARGVQIGYAGPFPFLQGKDYGGESWFKTLMGGAADHHVSDVYLGFRNQPHFTIAVRQTIDGQSYVARATVDPDRFGQFLRTITRERGVDSALINREGRYQVVEAGTGELFAVSPYLPPTTEGQGVEELRYEGRPMVVAYAWLREAPWALLARQPLAMAYAEFYKSRRVMLASGALIVLAVAGLVWFATNRLLRRAEATAAAREELRTELVHAAKLASLGELAAGVAHEINNPLAIVSAAGGVIRDMLDPEIAMSWDAPQAREQLDTIDAAVARARGITSQLLKFARKSAPRVAPCDINRLLDDVLGGFIEHELSVSGVRIARDYAPGLPDALVDPDQAGQVFVNLINNAADAIEGAGIITLSTRSDGRFVRVTVTDTGRGMTPEEVERVFTPFYTTKEVGKGTGLGLSVSLGIVQALGGDIDVCSAPGAGSAFTVTLPVAGRQDAERRDAGTRGHGDGE